MPTSCVGVNSNPEIGIERRAVPISAAGPTREDHAKLRSILRIWTAGHDATLELEQPLAVRLVLRSDLRDLIRRKRHSRNRRRLQRERLRRPVLVTGNRIVGHDRPLFDAENRRARHAIEDEQKALLRINRHGRNRSPVSPHVDQRRRRGQVVIPVVVMRRLKEPLQLAGRGVQREQRRAIQIRAEPIAAVEIGRGRACRHVRNPARFINGNESPRVGPGAIDPLIVLPRIVIRLARPAESCETSRRACPCADPTHARRPTVRGSALPASDCR